MTLLSMETITLRGWVTGTFLSMHYGLLGVYAYEAQNEKQGTTHSSIEPIECTTDDETKRKIILENSWVYFKGTIFFVCEDGTLSH